jgi:hypothetical protein
MSGRDILADQNEAILERVGIDTATAKAYHEFFKNIIDLSLVETDSAKWITTSLEQYTKWKAGMSQEQLTKLGVASDEAAKSALKNLSKILYLPWMQYFNKSDASVNYEKAYCPVLALNGSEDVQVLPKQNLGKIEAALKKSKSKNYEVKELPGLNHLFQHCKKCTPAEYGELEETFAPEALQLMVDWLKQTIK